jgi:hypothetical protein
MKKYFCDLCGVEVPSKSELRYLNITKEAENPDTGTTMDKPVIPEAEICIHCKVELQKILSSWEVKDEELAS